MSPVAWIAAVNGFDNTYIEDDINVIIENLPNNNITFVGEGNTITIYVDSRKYKFFRTKIYNV